MNGRGQPYPTAPVTFIAAAPPGGGWHQTCEATVQVLNAERLLPVEARIVETPGGLTVLEDVVTRRRGDGHTLVAFSPGLTLQILLKGSRYTYEDITPLASLSTDYGVLVVPVDSTTRMLGPLLERLSRGGESVTVTGGSGPGAMHHGMAALLARAANLPAGAVQYVGAASVAEGLAAVRQARVALGAFGTADVIEDVRRGTLRPIAVLGEERLGGVFAGVPTAREQGVEVVFPMWRGFYAPPDVGSAVVDYWADAFTRLSRSPAWTRLLEARGWFPFLLTGDRFRAFLAEDTHRYVSALGASGTAGSGAPPRPGPAREGG